MPCVNCGHAMQRIVTPWLWCPRCGTVVDESAEYASAFATPTLVERCREFDVFLRKYIPGIGETIPSAWLRLGLAESVRKSEDRTT